MFDWFSKRKEAVAKNEESDNIRRLGFVKKWTEEELRILKDNLGSALDKIKQLLPDKTEDDIIEKINNLYKEPEGNRWTDEEYEILKANPEKSIAQLMPLLPNRSFWAINQRVGIVNSVEHYRIFKTRNAWTEQEMETLKTMKNEGYSNYDIASVLNRPLNSVLGKLYTDPNMGKRAGVRKIQNRKFWSAEENEDVKNRISNGETIESIAEIYGVPASRIFNRGIHLGFCSTDINTEQKSRIREKYEEKGREITLLTNKLSENKAKLKEYKDTVFDVLSQYGFNSKQIKAIKSTIRGGIVDEVLKSKLTKKLSVTEEISKPSKTKKSKTKKIKNIKKSKTKVFKTKTTARNKQSKSSAKYKFKDNIREASNTGTYYEKRVGILSSLNVGLTRARIAEKYGLKKDALTYWINKYITNNV